MPLPVKLQDVVDALEAAADFCSHYLDKRTGEIVMLARIQRINELALSYYAASRGKVRFTG